VHFLRQIGIFIATLLGTCVPWYFLTLIALQIFGVPVKFGLGKAQRMNGAILWGLGKSKFVFIQGVLWWGWPVWGAQEIFHYLSNRTTPAAGDVIVGLLIWSAAGIWFGFTMWNKSEPTVDVTHPAG